MCEIADTVTPRSLAISVMDGTDWLLRAVWLSGNVPMGTSALGIAADVGEAGKQSAIHEPLDQLRWGCSEHDLLTDGALSNRSFLRDKRNTLAQGRLSQRGHLGGRLWDARTPHVPQVGVCDVIHA